MFVCFYVLKSNTVNVIYKWEQEYVLGLIEIQYIGVYLTLRCCEGKVEIWCFFNAESPSQVDRARIHEY